MRQHSSYAPLPSAARDADDAEMNAAFESDDEDIEEQGESHPLTGNKPSNTTSAPYPNSSSDTSALVAYDFENVDYDHPPPGSPPAVQGNSNGLIPTTRPVSPDRRTWLQRTAARVLPARFLPNSTRTSSGVVGSGTGNDGVFANVTAKPTAPNLVSTTAADGSIHLVPEDSSVPGAAPPPSYAAAQADAVPPYWETTVHIPGSSIYGSAAPGELIIDNLPTGSLFSFLWNMLVSVSFQFPGFLIAYLLHSTHAGRLGARAGLGVTLIQFGFALKSKAENDIDDPWSESWRGDGTLGGPPPAVPSFSSAAEADAYFGGANATMPLPMLTEEQASQLVADATTEWLSFLLMTIGWFVLLSSLLGFWRVKRWESGIMASQLENPHAADRPSSDLPVLTRIDNALGVRAGYATLSERLRLGLGFLDVPHQESDNDENARRAEEGWGPSRTRRDSGHDGVSPDGHGDSETDYMIPREGEQPTEREIQLSREEQQLHRRLQEAGFV